MKSLTLIGPWRRHKKQWINTGLHQGCRTARSRQKMLIYHSCLHYNQISRCHFPLGWGAFYQSRNYGEPCSTISGFRVNFPLLSSSSRQINTVFLANLSAIAFGHDTSSLRQMVTIANDVELNATRDPLHSHLPSSFHQALNTVRLRSVTCLTVS
jgi:hypothetical protein